MGVKKEDITKIDVMQVTIRSYLKYWSAESIYSFLKQIENYGGFKGFRRISFDVENLPEIVCYFNLQDKEELEKSLSKLNNK